MYKNVAITILVACLTASLCLQKEDHQLLRPSIPKIRPDWHIDVYYKNNGYTHIYYYNITSEEARQKLKPNINILEIEQIDAP